MSFVVPTKRKLSNRKRQWADLTIKRVKWSSRQSKTARLMAMMTMTPRKAKDQRNDASPNGNGREDEAFQNVEEIDGIESDHVIDASAGLGMDQEVSILGEVVCAHQLIKDDSSSQFDGDDDHKNGDTMYDSNMNPFCIVSFRKKEIHRTAKSAQPGTNPYWTISSRSLFIITATVRDLALDGCLEVSLWTKQKDALLNISTVDTLFLGRACISAETILANCQEQPVVVKLYDSVVDTGLGSRGSLTLHFRLATPADERYVLGQRRRRAVTSSALSAAWPLMKQSSSGSISGGSDGSVASSSLLLPSSPKSTPEQQQQSQRPPLETMSSSGALLGSLYDAIHGPSSGIMSPSSNATSGSSKTTPPNLEPAQQDATPSSKAEDIVPIPTEVDDAQAAGTSFVNALSSAFKTKSYFDKTAGQQKILVKPHPDPHRVGATTYLSAREIKLETMTKPSQQWIEAGSGRLGKLYLEVLACHNLPNMDTGETVGNLTDAFVCAVFEDAMVQTAVIDDELSPHWLPWTQRAFIFGIMHPASMLYLGCFDFDFGISDHEKIGRVAVNISTLQRDTDYTLTYNLYPSSNVTERTANGTLTIRLRVEYHDEKQALMEAVLKERPVVHVNVKREKTLKVVHYTCFGEYGDESEEKFDLTVTRSYVNEILEYKRALTYCFGDVLRSLVFWRGQVKILGLMLPLHSFLFFCAGSTLVEHPSMLPAFMILSIAWVMIALGTKRQQHPSPWERGQSFWHYVEVLRTGRSHLRIRRIAANEGAKDAAAYEKQWTDRLARDEDTANRRYQMEQQLHDLGRQAEIHTKMNNTMIPIDLLDKLARWQGILGRLVRKFRFIKIIVTWEESIVSFWFTAGFLVAGLVSLFLPWTFILTWLGRGIVWGCLGPHMMIVDAYLHSNSEDDEKLLQKTMKKFKEDRLHARARHQQASKLKDLKCQMFGKYITLVPNFNLNRHFDRPIACSFARLHQQQDESENKVMKLPNKSIPGQQFFGVMVPRTQPAAMEFEKEQPKLQKTLEAVLQGISRIHEAKRLKLEDRLEKSMRINSPDSVGFELVEGESIGHDDNDDNNNLVHNAATEENQSVASSVDVDEKPKTAVLSFFRQSSTRRNNRESVRVGFELLTPPASSNDNGGQGGVDRSSSWPLVGGAEGSDTIDENAEEDVSSGHDISRNQRPRLMRCHSATGVLRGSVQAMAVDMSMSYDDDQPDQEENGIEVILRTIEEEDDNATLAAQSSHDDQNDKDEEHVCASHQPPNDKRNIQYRPTRTLGHEEDADDEPELSGHDDTKQRPATMVRNSGMSSDKLEDESRDGEELQSSRRLGDQNDKNATSTEVARRTT